MQTYRIAMVAACPFPEPRGTPVRILRMAQALADRGHEVHIVTYHLGSGEVGSALKLHRIAKLKTYRKRSPGPSYQKILFVDPLLTALLFRILRRLSIDVIHAHHYEGLLVAAIARLGTTIPLVYDAHTLLSSELPLYSLALPTRVKAFLGRQLDASLPKCADHVVCVTETIRQSLIDETGMSPSRLTVISNGVEVERFDPKTPVVGERNRPRKIIFAGNLAPYQGIDLLLKAFREVVQKRGDVRLVIATHSSFEEYESLARELRIRESIEVIPAPAFDRLPALLADADLTVNPRTECSGIPVKLLNYMAAAKPVVSFVASAPGVVHHQTGWLVENGNVPAFAEAMLELLNKQQLAVELGRRARRYVEENCRWPIVAERVEGVYRKVIKKCR